MGSGEPKDPKRFISYAKWAVAIAFTMWAASFCVEFNGPAVDNPPRFQEGELDVILGDDYRSKQDQKPARDTDWNEDRGPEPTSLDPGAYDDPRYEGP